MIYSNIAIIGSLIVASITIIGNIIITVISKRTEFNQSLYKSIIEIAMKDYEYKTNLAIEHNGKYGGGYTLVPFTDYLIFYTQFIKVLNKNKIKESDMESFFKNNKNAKESFRKYYPQYMTEKNDN